MSNPPSILPNSPSVHPPIFSRLFPFIRRTTRGELNRTWLPASSQVWKLFAATHCPRSSPATPKARAATFPPPPSPLFSPLFIIIRAFYRAPSVQEPTTIKRVGTLCSFDSVVANLLAPLFLSPLHNCFRRLHALIEHPVLAAPAPWETHLSQFQDVSHRVLDEIGISRKEEGKEGYFLSKEFFLFFLSFFG